eukprot:14351-Heterococcus_DN1.PRE.1
MTDHSSSVQASSLQQQQSISASAAPAAAGTPTAALVSAFASESGQQLTAATDQQQQQQQQAVVVVDDGVLLPPVQVQSARTLVSKRSVKNMTRRLSLTQCGESLVTVKLYSNLCLTCNSLHDTTTLRLGESFAYELAVT